MRYNYQVRRIKEDDLQDELNHYARDGYRLHTIKFSYTQGVCICVFESSGWWTPSTEDG